MKEDELTSFDNTSQDMLNTLQTDKVNEMNVKLKTFFKKWNQCHDTAVERLNGYVHITCVPFLWSSKEKGGGRRNPNSCSPNPNP